MLTLDDRIENISSTCEYGCCGRYDDLDDEIYSWLEMIIYPDENTPSYDDMVNVMGYVTSPYCISCKEEVAEDDYGYFLSLYFCATCKYYTPECFEYVKEKSKLMSIT